MIIPTFNPSTILHEAIHSILSQSYRHFEILIIDNASDASTLKILEQYSSQDERIRFVTEKDNGIYDAMNKGVKFAKGDWLYFMGADDRLYNNKIFEQLLPFTSKSVDIIYGDCCYIPNDILERGEWTLERLLHANLNHQRLFYRRELLEKNLYSDEFPIAADYELNIRLFCNHAVKKQYIPVTIVNYYSGGVSSKKVDKRFAEKWEVIFIPQFLKYFTRKKIYEAAPKYIRQQLNYCDFFSAAKVLVRYMIYTGNVGFLLLFFRDYFHTSKLFRKFNFFYKRW